MTKVTIKDVAERAGVSTATVSHVINHTRFVSEETRQRVLAAIEALNYQPNAIARGLVTNSTQTIGLLVPDITNPFFTAVARGVEDKINQHGYHTIFCNTDEDPAREDEYLRLLAARQIDGLIVVPTGMRSERLIRLAEGNLPIILLDRETPEVAAPLISVDNESGAYQATQYLIELGHQRIGILAGVETISTMELRVDGYKRALKEAGIPIEESLIVRADSRFNVGPLAAVDLPFIRHPHNQNMPNAFQALKNLLDNEFPPSAIFVTNNQMTLWALHALRESHLRCPEDLSIIGFDDHDWALLSTPPLTVFRQPIYQLGQTAADLLMKLIQQQAVQPPSLFPVELIVRESCQPPRKNSSR